MDHLSFAPHGVCYLWQTDLIALHMFGDLVIAVAYFSIPLLLWLAFRTRPHVLHSTLTLWFGAFIACCGLTHVLEVIAIWSPIYYLQGGMKALTAVVSLGALHALYRVVTEEVAPLFANRAKLHQAVDDFLASVMAPPQ